MNHPLNRKMLMHSPFLKLKSIFNFKKDAATPCTYLAVGHDDVFDRLGFVVVFECVVKAVILR